ncbi:MAG TPA: glycosyltransferase, partial [Syntrophorhabdaceae bacterium]|nr:glycosyltransferase [Syntrophorhabdaceae bacterium]
NPERDPCSFIAVTRLVAKKGIMHLLNAFKKVHELNPSVNLHIIGDGPMRDEVESFIRKHNLNKAVNLHSSKPNEFVLEKLRQSSVYVQHSITDAETGNREGLPNSILEAQAVGLPVVATNHEGIPEAVEHGVTGFLVDEGDVDKMAEYMFMLSKDGELRRKMGLKGREKMIKDGFTTDEMIRKIRDFMGINKSDEKRNSNKRVVAKDDIPKRVLFVNHSIYPYELSGTPLSTYNHAIGMKKKGLEVGVLIPSGEVKEGATKELNEDFVIYKVPALNKFKTFLLTLDKTFLKQYLDLVRKILIEFQPDIIHVNDYVFMPVEMIKTFKEFGSIVVRGICNVEELCYFDSPVIEAGKQGILCSGPESAFKCAQCLEVNILNRSGVQISISEKDRLLLYEQKFKYIEEIYKTSIDGVVFTTEEFKNYFCRFIEMPSEKTRVIPRGFDFNFKRDIVNKFDNNDNTICFGYFGNLIYRKGIDVLLKAFERIADLEGFRLEIYGAAIQEYLNWVKDLQKTYPLKIRYAGPYDYNDLIDIAKHVHVAIAPSYFETYNRVVRELLFLGIPVIVTDFFGSSIIKDGINGLRIPNGDHKALAEALKKLINDKELLKKLSKGAIETKIPSLEEEIEGLYEFYLDTLKNIKSLQSNPYLKEKMESVEQLIENQKLDQAKNELELIISEYPNYAPAYNELAGVYYRKGDKEKTAYYLEKAIRLKPDDTLILKNLANLYIEFERIDEAKELYEKVISIDPKDRESQEILAHLRELVRGFDELKPLVSIVIPVLNNLHFTIRCVDSIVKNGSDLPYEIIVVDNGSTDETESYFKGLKISHLHYFRLENNLGFVGGCNFGASRARGEYILFLNNDTEAQPGWLDALVETFRSYPDCGACGAKLVYPDGKLQEAGGIIFSDGTGWNYGRGMDPQDPRFNFVREVDYCSGAALMVRRDLWEQIGGFDERYTPAYYEDTDLCFEIRRRGYKVYYQPKSVIIHYEGKTAGIDLSGGFKKYQVSNREKFIQKWKEDLKKQFNFDVKNVLNASERGVKKRILVLDHFLPMFDKASGSLRLFNILKSMKAINCHVSFIAMNNEGEAKYRPILEEIGVETYTIFNFSSGNALNVEALSAFLKERDFDYA